MITFPATNLIPVSTQQLAFIINQRGVNEVVVCGLRQSGRTGITRVLAKLLSFHNPLWEAVAPEEPIGLTSVESAQKLEGMEYGEIFEIPPVSVIGSTGFSVRQADLRECLEPLPENTLRVMIETRPVPGDKKSGNTAMFVTIDGLCYHAGAGYYGNEEIPRYILQGAPTWMGSEVLAQNLRDGEHKSDLEMFFTYLHVGFVQQLNITLFGGGAEWPEGVKVEELPEQMPAEWRDHLLTHNTLHPVYDAVRQARPKPLTFQPTGVESYKADEAVAEIKAMAAMTFYPQAGKEDGYLVRRVSVRNDDGFTVVITYANPKNVTDTYEQLIAHSDDEVAAYRVGQFLSQRLAVMLDMPQKMFGQNIVTIGSL